MRFLSQDDLRSALWKAETVYALDPEDPGSFVRIPKARALRFCASRTKETCVTTGLGSVYLNLSAEKV